MSIEYSKNWYKILIIGLLLFIVISAGAYKIYKNYLNQKEPAPPAIDFEQLKAAEINLSKDQDGTPNVNTISSNFSSEYPPELNLKITFYSQAPFADWGMPWQEACEEASALLVANSYFKHNWTREEFNQQILDLVDWETQYFGQYQHTTAQETGVFLDKYLGLKNIIHENPTFEDVQKILNQGNLIIMPFAGKLLGNPNYTNGGPNYHMMVIKGYKTNPDKIITADVGTRKGEDYVYSWQRIETALHDYAVPMEQGGKRMIEVLRP